MGVIINRVVPTAHLIPLQHWVAVEVGIGILLALAVVQVVEVVG
jgi:hypothetical protein